MSATTIATLLRQSSLGPAPRRIGPTWTQFLRLQAYALLSPGPRSNEEDTPEDVASGPQEPLAPIGEERATTEHGKAIHDDLARPKTQPVVTADAPPRAWVSAVPPGGRAHARDGPAMAA